jgi:hypothetical protein
MMIILRCTQKLRKYLGITPLDQPDPPSATLGNWYANLIPTAAGDLIIFVNERTLLTVAIPAWESDRLLELFRLRVANLLGMIGLPQHIIDRERSHFDQIQFGKTASRSVLGSLNDFAWQYQSLAEEARSKADLSLSNAEFNMSQVPCGPLDYQFPAEVARMLLYN